MQKAFTFGKYLPFHKGHQALIDFALTKSDYLYVVVCASKSEKIPASVRANWIRATYPAHSNLEVIEFTYDESELPNTSVASREVSEVWSHLFSKLLPKIDTVITSEPYGEFVAEYMNVTHLPFDPQRAAVPISATQIRGSICDHWDFLPDAVKRHYQRKMVFLGTECTGKTSLSEAISQQINASWVSEVGRDIVADSNDFSPTQLWLIAEKHAENIQQACAELKPFVFIDTDIHITQSYSKFEFGEYQDFPAEWYASHAADFYVYLAKDLPFFQDGTRLDEKDRNQLDECHRETLRDFGIEFVEISGTWKERLQKLNRFV